LLIIVLLYAVDFLLDLAQLLPNCHSLARKENKQVN